ncbi:hypothetical protein [Sinosporangium siamense]|uniref:Uncharacterized protein n=1 Tax=Sinosporangium siamense TaxID=1367973 RepID=A0A919RDW3_9ACTN|nr:hypothetical protein [Sinosporangium siamense]GII90629.1 hypothetical protein Ssi02_08600 [Sinosporangium siamense]
MTSAHTANPREVPAQRQTTEGEAGQHAGTLEPVRALLHAEGFTTTLTRPNPSPSGRPLPEELNVTDGHGWELAKVAVGAHSRHYLVTLPPQGNKLFMVRPEDIGDIPRLIRSPVIAGPA